MANKKAQYSIEEAPIQMTKNKVLVRWASEMKEEAKIILANPDKAREMEDLGDKNFQIVVAVGPTEINAPTVKIGDAILYSGLSKKIVLEDITYDIIETYQIIGVLTNPKF